MTTIRCRLQQWRSEIVGDHGEHAVSGRRVQSASIDQRKSLARDRRVVPVPRHAGHIIDDRVPRAKDAIEQHRNGEKVYRGEKAAFSSRRNCANRS
jgi:hypothetical protein